MTQSTEHRHSPRPNWCNFKLLWNVNFRPPKNNRKVGKVLRLAMKNYISLFVVFSLRLMLNFHAGIWSISIVERDSMRLTRSMHSTSIDISLWGRQKFSSFLLQTIRIRLSPFIMLCYELCAISWLLSEYVLIYIQLSWFDWAKKNLWSRNIFNRKCLTKVSFHNQLW